MIKFCLFVCLSICLYSNCLRLWICDTAFSVKFFQIKECFKCIGILSPCCHLQVVHFWGSPPDGQVMNWSFFLFQSINGFPHSYKRIIFWPFFASCWLEKKLNYIHFVIDLFICRGDIASFKSWLYRPDLILKTMQLSCLDNLYWTCWRLQEKNVQAQKEEKKREKRKKCTNPKAEMTKSHLMRDICSGSSIHLKVKESIDET